MNAEEKVLQIQKEISRYIPMDKFLRLQERLTELRKEEEEKLKALAELQKAYLAANSDSDREVVKMTVRKIRELSKLTRTEIRSLTQELSNHMPLSLAHDFYQRLLEAQAHNPK